MNKKNPVIFSIAILPLESIEIPHIFVSPVNASLSFFGMGLLSNPV